MVVAREVEIRQNYSYFKSVVASMMAEHAGQFALIRSCEVVDVFETAGEAVSAGAVRFGELPFSVQRVINRPIDLGFLSHAADNGITV
jgi:hypothetical protein